MYIVNPVTTNQIKKWILEIHYAKRMPPISFAFGLFRDSHLVGVVTYGMPASPFLCKGVCGNEWSNRVLELNRLVLKDNLKNEASMLVGRSLKQIPPPRIIVSYADTDWNHIGYVYQATNWLYTGKTKARTDIYSEAGHSRHHCGDPTKRQPRSAKHRYVYFVGDKRQKRIFREALNYPVLEYPKGDVSNYETEEIEAQQMSLL